MRTKNDIDKLLATSKNLLPKNQSEKHLAEKKLDKTRTKFAALGITEADVADAVNWARRK